MSENAVLIGIVSALTGLLVKIVDLIYQYIKNKTVGDKQEEYLEEMVHSIRELNALLSKVDGDSVPLIYCPRRLLIQSDAHNEFLRGLSYHSDITSKSLEKLIEAMNSITRVLDRLDDRPNCMNYSNNPQHK